MAGSGEEGLYSRQLCVRGLGTGTGTGTGDPGPGRDGADPRAPLTAPAPAGTC